MTTMRAMTMAAAGGPEVLSMSEIERPVRISAEVLVKVVAAGVNPIDIKTRNGKGAFGAVAASSPRARQRLQRDRGRGSVCRRIRCSPAPRSTA